MVISVLNTKMSKWLFFIIITLLVIIAVILLSGQISLDSKHKNEIIRVISERGGDVEKIRKITNGSGPFEEVNKSNVIYEVFYTKESKGYIAWYRGIKVPANIHARNPTAIDDRFNEKWIFDHDK